MRFAALAALALCCAAAPAAPRLALGVPWQGVRSAPTAGSVTLAEWILPNGRPDQSPANSQYVRLATRDLDTGGLGDFVAGLVATFGRSNDVTGLRYATLDECPRKAYLFTFDAPAAGIRRSYEEVFIATSTLIYEAQYQRPADQPVDPVAHAALLAFCRSQAPL